MVFKNGSDVLATLADLGVGAEGVLESIEMADDDARRLMELGFLPGHAVRCSRLAPLGGPRVYQVDGVEVALRRDTAAQIRMRNPAPALREAS